MNKKMQITRQTRHHDTTHLLTKDNKTITTPLKTNIQDNRQYLLITRSTHIIALCLIMHM